MRQSAWLFIMLKILPRMTITCKWQSHDPRRQAHGSGAYVLTNDPTKGYGDLLETMLEAALHAAYQTKRQRHLPLSFLCAYVKLGQFFCLVRVSATWLYFPKLYFSLP